MSQPACHQGILLSGFADEVVASKSFDIQCSVFAALGLRYLSLRFVDVGQGARNLMDLDDRSLDRVQDLLKTHDLSVSSIGSPIGKILLRDVDDGTGNRYCPFDEYLQRDVNRAFDLAERFQTRLVRGFSFYPPRGEKPEDHLDEVVDRLRAIADAGDQRGLTFGLEVEANLVGQTGDLLAEIHRRVDHPALVLVFDGGNLVTQGFTTEQVFEQYLAMKPGLGWIHIKDYANRRPGERIVHVDEEALCDFVPADRGDSGYPAILADLFKSLPEMTSRLAERGIPGLFADLEPHVRGGGQFGGYSGPDGFGIALRAFGALLDEARIPYRLREFPDLKSCSASNRGSA